VFIKRVIEALEEGEVEAAKFSLQVFLIEAEQWLLRCQDATRERPFKTR
jgi:hypothetical protein